MEGTMGIAIVLFFVIPALLALATLGFAIAWGFKKCRWYVPAALAAAFVGYLLFWGWI